MTTGDGNCLYNAISLALYGNESLSKEIRLRMVFIFLEYEDYFRNVAISFSFSDSLEILVEKASTLGDYGSDFNMIALSLLFFCPIKCYSMSSMSLSIDTSKLNRYPIFISLKDVNYTPIVPLDNLFFIANTTANQLNFFKYDCGELKYY